MEGVPEKDWLLCGLGQISEKMNIDGKKLNNSDIYDFYVIFL